MRITWQNINLSIMHYTCIGDTTCTSCKSLQTKDHLLGRLKLQINAKLLWWHGMSMIYSLTEHYQFIIFANHYHTLCSWPPRFKVIYHSSAPTPHPVPTVIRVGLTNTWHSPNQVWPSSHASQGSCIIPGCVWHKQCQICHKHCHHHHTRAQCTYHLGTTIPVVGPLWNTTGHNRLQEWNCSLRT